MAESLEDISVLIWWILINFCWVRTFFDVLLLNIFWTVAQTPIKHTIFWKSMMRSFRWIWINCFNRLKFLAEFSTNFQNMHSLVHCGLQNTQFWRKKLWDQNSFPFDSRNIHIKESKTRLCFFYQVETQICLIPWFNNPVAKFS